MTFPSGSVPKAKVWSFTPRIAQPQGLFRSTRSGHVPVTTCTSTCKLCRCNGTGDENTRIRCDSADTCQKVCRVDYVSDLGQKDRPLLLQRPEAKLNC